MSTLQNFGVPVGTSRGPMLSPKLKHKFGVRFYGFGPFSTPVDLSANVESIGKPNFTQTSIEVHTYNSVMYLGGKHAWNTIELVVRDDVSNAVTRIVGHQEQKQVNHFTQTTPLAGSNYKFNMKCDTRDGGNDAILESFEYEGCWLESVNYGDFDYKDTGGYSTISMTIRFDNVTQGGGLMPLIPEISPGVLI